MGRSLPVSLAACALGAAAAVGCGGDDEAPIDETRYDDAAPVQIDLDGSLQNPAWAPDGASLLITRFRDGYNAEPADLFVVELGTGATRPLVSDGSGNVNLPGSAWNAATGTIAFSSSREPHDEIFLIPGDGAPGDEQPVTDRPDDVAYEPTLSPDGQWVVFESHVLDQEDNGVITKLRADGSGDYVALTDPDDDCRQPNWAPAGGRILYQRFAGGQWDIWTIDEDGAGATRITAGPGDKTDASFSPDGEWIVYSSDAGELDLANIFVIPAAGGDPIRVTEWAGYDGAPSWSPDGTRIAFESYPGDPDECPGTAIWIVDAPAL